MTTRSRKLLESQLVTKIQELLPEFCTVYEHASNSKSLKTFFIWARTVISRPVISDDQARRDPNVSAKEAPDYTVKDSEDLILRLARVLGGLIYYRKKNDPSIVSTIRYFDDSVELNIKKHAARADVDRIYYYLAANEKGELLKILDDLELFYLGGT